MKKLIRMLFCSILIIGLMSSCQMSSKNGYGDGLTSIDAKDKIVLTIMIPQTHYRDFLKTILSQYESQNPNYKIDVKIIPDNQWIDLVKMKFAVGETPDLIHIDKGLIIDVGTKYFTVFDEKEPWYNRVIIEQLENKKIGGVLYGLPVGSSTCIGIVYNKQMFIKEDIKQPKSMEELIEICKIFKAKGIIPIYASDKDSWTTQLGFNSSAPQIIGKKTWENLRTNKIKWADIPEFEEVLNTFAQIRTNGYTNPDYVEATYESALNAMANEKVAMYIIGRFFINDVHKINPNIELMMMPTPYHGDLLTIIQGPGQLAVPKKSKHIDVAKSFLNWFSQPDIMDIFNAGWGHMTVYKDQKMKMSESQQMLYDNYIVKGKTVLQIDEEMSGIDLNDFWGFQQELMGGSITAKEVLEKWDVAYESQMREKGDVNWQE